MRVYIRDIGETAHLTMRGRNGEDYALDTIGNAGALVDGSFEYMPDMNAYGCTEAVFEWWQHYMRGGDLVEALIAKVAESANLFEEDVRDEVRKNMGLDYDFHYPNARLTLQRLCAEHGARWDA